MKNRMKKNKLIIATICVILIVVLMYLFILPIYVMDKIKKANYMDVWYGEIRYQTEDVEVISALLDNISIPKWKRIWTTDVQRLGLPDAYITVNRKYNMDFWIEEEECFIKVYFQSSNFEIASYHTNTFQFNMLP